MKPRPPHLSKFMDDYIGRNYSVITVENKMVHVLDNCPANIPSAWEVIIHFIRYGADPNEGDTWTLIDLLLLSKPLESISPYVRLLVAHGGRPRLVDPMDVKTLNHLVRACLDANERARTSTRALGAALKCGREKVPRDLQSVLMKYVWLTRAAEGWLK
jgi:hypothetical protein